MFTELMECRELITRLAMRDFSAKYRQSVLGYIWAVMIPVIAIGTFMLLNRAGVLAIGKTDAPYPLFALIGLSVWQLFSSGIISGTNSLVTAGSMIGKINFPRETLVIAAMTQPVFEFMIKSVLICVLFVYFGFTPHWQIVFFPAAVIPIFIFTVALSLLFSLINGIFRDTANMVSLCVNFLLFLTPVLYPTPEKFAGVFKFNIFTALINGPRDLVIYGRITEPVGFLISTAVVLIFFMFSWRLFHLAETKIPERI